MGKFLLLAHLQNVPCANAPQESSPEDLPIKNTFIHFEIPRECNNIREAAMPRHRTAPLQQESKSLHGSCDQSDAEPVDFLKAVDSLCRWTTMDGDDDCTLASHLAAMDGDDASTLASDGKSVLFDNDIYAMPAAGQSVCDDMSSVAEDAFNESSAQNQNAEMDRVLNYLISNEMPMLSPPSLQVEQEDAGNQESISTWLVDGRRLRGRDTRVSSVLRPPLAGGPAFAELVMSIFPLPVSSKRGGANFKAANGIGRIQLKCNNPVDVELFVCIAVGSGPRRCEKHNFANNPLMTFNADWDFKAAIDPMSDRPTVAVTLQLLEAKEGADLPMCERAFTTTATASPAVMDPAIVALGHVKAHVYCVSEGEPKQSSPFTPSSTTSQGTPEVTPRPHLQQSCVPATPQLPPPSPSPFFSLGGSLLFMFTIRRADGVELGLDVMVDEVNQELTVRNVIPNGAAEAWNRQCFAGPYSSKAIVPTDRIVGINGRCDCQGMLEECRERQLLKIFVVRGDLPHMDIPAGFCGVPDSIPTIQFVAVPVFFPVPCVKHDIVDYHGGLVPTSPPCSEAPISGVLRASAPEFIPPETGQEQGEVLLEILQEEAELTEDEFSE